VYIDGEIDISFVRCIKPNGDEKAGEFDETLVGLQLAAVGVLQVWYIYVYVCVYIYRER